MKIGRVLICLVCALAAGLQVYAFQRPAAAEQQILRDAEGALSDSNFPLAKQKAEQIRDSQGSVGERAKVILKLIDDITENNRKMQSARLAIQRNKLVDACGYLHDVQAAIDANSQLKSRYPDLNNLKTQASCTKPESSQESASPAEIKASALPTEPVDTAKPEYEKAAGLMNSGEYKEALAVFKRIQATHPGYKDIGEHIRKASQEIERTEKMGKESRFTDLLARANKRYAAGDFEAAIKLLNQAEPLRPADQGLKNLRQQITDALKKDRSELETAVNAFSGGNYDQAHKALLDFLARPHSALDTSCARFYAGAALAGKYFISGSKDDSSKTAAIQMFQLSAKGDAVYSPQWNSISPKIKSLYEEATK
jgi:TolA-binding protein